MLKLDHSQTGPHTPTRGRMELTAADNPGYAPGNHYTLERTEGNALVAYHKVQCFAQEGGPDQGVYFDLFPAEKVLATWIFLLSGG